MFDRVKLSRVMQLRGAQIADDATDVDDSTDSAAQSNDDDPDAAQDEQLDEDELAESIKVAEAKKKSAEKPAVQRLRVPRTVWGTGGPPKPFFENDPPRALAGKSVSGVLDMVHRYEKQKMRLYYGAIRDGKFRWYVDEAKRARYNTDAKLMRMLEMRLDTLLYRTGFVHTPAQARQWIGHGKIRINGYKHDKRNAQLEPGDVITFKDDFIDQVIEAALAAAYTRKLLKCGASWIPTNPTPVGMIPWLEVDRRGLSAAIVRYPHNFEVRTMRSAAMFPYVRNANLNPYAAMRAYR